MQKQPHCNILTISGTSLSFAYDASGLRTSKTVNGTTYRYFYMDSKLMRMTWGSNTVDFFYDANGTPYSMKYNGALYYYVTNLQGDIMRVVNASGTVVASYDYDPYGKVISTTGSLANVNPLRYRGYVYDTETEFYYLQSRYYDPEICRFINADSLIAIDDSLSLNVFVYCSNNPVIMIDHNGKDGKTVDLGKGWYYRVDKAINKTRRHIHIWKEGGKSYAQNDDGSPHDKGKNDQGKLPKWVQNAVKEKAGWDYNGNRERFFQQTEHECTDAGIDFSFADGTFAFQAYSFMPPAFTTTHLESVYFNTDKPSNTVNTSVPKPFLPLLPPSYLPTFSFGYSWGLVPVPLLF